jgi:DnaJ-domain-containing protein 1
MAAWGEKNTASGPYKLQTEALVRIGVEREQRAKVLKQKMLEALEAADYDTVAALGEEFAALEKMEESASSVSRVKSYKSSHESQSQ